MNTTDINTVFAVWIIAFLLMGAGAAFITWAVTIAKSSKKSQKKEK